MTDSSTTPDAFALFTEIGILAQLSRALLESRLPDGVTMPQFGVIQHLVLRGNGPTPLELARAFQVPKTSMTNTLAALQKRGLIETRPNPGDGRSKGVWLTTAGAALRQQAIADLSGELHALVEAFPPEYLAELLPRLRDLRQWLDAARNSDRPAP